MPRSVIYFGGRSRITHPIFHDVSETVTSDKVVEYKNLKWTLIGNLAGPRDGHRSIKMNNKIYLFGGVGTT